MSSGCGDKRPSPGGDGGSTPAKRQKSSAVVVRIKREPSEPTAPVPSQWLRHCTAPLVEAPLTVALSMSADAYLAAREQPKLCNLQLTVAAVSAQELAEFPALLPAADGFVLSKLVSGRLQSEDPPSTAGGVTQLQLCIGVEQQVLDAVVRAVYARQLSIGPENAESLLLVAEHLQLDWLTKAVSAYLKQHVLLRHPLALCQLSQRFGLDLFQPAVDFMLQRPDPQMLVALVRLVPEAANRVRLFKAISSRTTPPQCLRFMSLLQSGPEETRPTELELHAVIGRHPELAVALMQLRQEGPLEAAECEAQWQRHFSLHHRAMLFVNHPPALIWALPVKQLRQSECQQLCCVEKLRLDDGRSFQLLAMRGRMEGGSEWHMGLYVAPHGGAVWQRDDLVRFSAVKAPPHQPKREAFRIPESNVGSSCGCGRGMLIDEWTAICKLTFFSGTYLPVQLEIVPAHPSA